MGSRWCVRCERWQAILSGAEGDGDGVRGEPSQGTSAYAAELRQCQQAVDAPQEKWKVQLGAIRKLAAHLKRRKTWPCENASDSLDLRKVCDILVSMALLPHSSSDLQNAAVSALRTLSEKAPSTVEEVLMTHIRALLDASGAEPTHASSTSEDWRWWYGVRGMVQLSVAQIPSSQQTTTWLKYHFQAFSTLFQNWPLGQACVEGVSAAVMLHSHNLLQQFALLDNASAPSALSSPQPVPDHHSMMVCMMEGLAKTLSRLQPSILRSAPVDNTSSGAGGDDRAADAVEGQDSDDMSQPSTVAAASLLKHRLSQLLLATETQSITDMKALQSAALALVQTIVITCHLHSSGGVRAYDQQQGSECGDVALCGAEVWLEEWARTHAHALPLGEQHIGARNGNETRADGDCRNVMQPVTPATMLALWRAMLQTDACVRLLLVHFPRVFFPTGLSFAAHVCTAADDLHTPRFAMECLDTWLKTAAKLVTSASPLLPSLPADSIVRTCADVVLHHVDDPLDKTRHQVRDLFESIIAFSNATQTPEERSAVHRMVLQRLKRLPWTARGKYPCLQQLSRSIGVGAVLDAWPDLAPRLLAAMALEATAKPAHTLFVDLAVRHRDECSVRAINTRAKANTKTTTAAAKDTAPSPAPSTSTTAADKTATPFEVWANRWLRPAVHALTTGSDFLRKTLLELTIPKLFAVDRQCVLFAIRTLRSPAHHSSSALLALTSLLRHSRAAGLIDHLPSSWTQHDAGDHDHVFAQPLQLNDDTELGGIGRITSELPEHFDDGSHNHDADHDDSDDHEDHGDGDEGAVIHPTLIQVALAHASAEIRANALAFLCEARKTKTVPSSFELRGVQFFLEWNKLVSSSERKGVERSLRKLLSRLQSVYGSKKTKSSVADDADGRAVISSCSMFITWLWHFAFQLMAPHEPFQTRALGQALLDQLLSCLPPAAVRHVLARTPTATAAARTNNGKQDDWTTLPLTCSERRTLTQSMLDRYEINRLGAFNLLATFGAAPVALRDYFLPSPPSPPPSPAPAVDGCNNDDDNGDNDDHGDRDDSCGVDDDGGRDGGNAKEGKKQECGHTLKWLQEHSARINHINTHFAALVQALSYAQFLNCAIPPFARIDKMFGTLLAASNGRVLDTTGSDDKAPAVVAGNTLEDRSTAAAEAVQFMLAGDTATQTRARHVLWLINQLHAKVDQCGPSRMVALHGTMETIRHLLIIEPFVDTSNSHGATNQQHMLWSSLMLMLWQELRRVVAFTMPTVAASAPEGFSGDGDGDDLSASSSEALDQDMGAKVHLVCCWRAMREVAFITALLVLRFPFAPAASTTITPTHAQTSGDMTGGGALRLTWADALCMGQQLYTGLLQSRHRGVVEVMSSSFQAICSRLWIHFPDHLSGWLEDAMCSIRNADRDSITRRSAGFPLVVLSILRSAPSARRSRLVHRGVDALLRIACRQGDTEQAPRGDWRGDAVPNDEERGGDDASDAAKTTTTTHDAAEGDEEEDGDMHVVGHRSNAAVVHAYNVLRAIMRDESMSKHSSSGTARAYALALDGFVSPVFAVRNAAMMLFSSLQTRLLGTNGAPSSASSAPLLSSSGDGGGWAGPAYMDTLAALQSRRQREEDTRHAPTSDIVPGDAHSTATATPVAPPKVAPASAGRVLTLWSILSSNPGLADLILGALQPQQRQQQQVAEEDKGQEKGVEGEAEQGKEEEETVTKSTQEARDGGQGEETQPKKGQSKIEKEPHVDAAVGAATSSVCGTATKRAYLSLVFLSGLDNRAAVADGDVTSKDGQLALRVTALLRLWAASPDARVRRLASRAACAVVPATLAGTVIRELVTQLSRIAAPPTSDACTSAVDSASNSETSPSNSSSTATATTSATLTAQAMTTPRQTPLSFNAVHGLLLQLSRLIRTHAAVVDVFELTRVCCSPSWTRALVPTTNTSLWVPWVVQAEYWCVVSALVCEVHRRSRDPQQLYDAAAVGQLRAVRPHVLHAFTAAKRQVTAVLSAGDTRTSAVASVGAVAVPQHTEPGAARFKRAVTRALLETQRLLCGPMQAVAGATDIAADSTEAGTQRVGDSGREHGRNNGTTHNGGHSGDTAVDVSAVSNTVDAIDDVSVPGLAKMLEDTDMAVGALRFYSYGGMGLLSRPAFAAAAQVLWQQAYPQHRAPSSTASAPSADDQLRGPDATAALLSALQKHLVTASGRSADGGAACSDAGVLGRVLSACRQLVKSPLDEVRLGAVALAGCVVTQLCRLHQCDHDVVGLYMAALAPFTTDLPDPNVACAVLCGLDALPLVLRQWQMWPAVRRTELGARQVLSGFATLLHLLFHEEPDVAAHAAALVRACWMRCCRRVAGDSGHDGRGGGSSGAGMVGGHDHHQLSAVASASRLLVLCDVAVGRFESLVPRLYLARALATYVQEECVASGLRDAMAQRLQAVRSDKIPGGDGGDVGDGAQGLLFMHNEALPLFPVVDVLALCLRGVEEDIEGSDATQAAALRQQVAALWRSFDATPPVPAEAVSDVTDATGAPTTTTATTRASWVWGGVGDAGAGAGDDDDDDDDRGDGAATRVVQGEVPLDVVVEMSVQRVDEMSVGGRHWPIVCRCRKLLHQVLQE
ncbi:hypothetical protein PTSG_05667 [Salpingoeca rosetta]|uniref:Uncharacterized protein n=1 Tax=Salpingoeca rosetta (strain ATCC 50818 / BSB-021) TaxID=946362 RepID=F2UBV7_SALR5|nr:uncharacterized protein PTSG_05667 [Salpingoeca rosetta]EGD73973.1 hypothetical protein PTSG_05667 [Salpingoeca rosetta]|eukprot:XP_004993536.1 hypothetical protein PTSG_05667 [Salpingoeca rosetta]